NAPSVLHVHERCSLAVVLAGLGTSAWAVAVSRAYLSGRTGGLGDAPHRRVLRLRAFRWRIRLNVRRLPATFPFMATASIQASEAHLDHRLNGLDHSSRQSAWFTFLGCGAVGRRSPRRHHVGEFQRTRTDSPKPRLF